MADSTVTMAGSTVTMAGSTVPAARGSGTWGVPAPALTPGAPVEVRTRFIPGRWARGFEVAQACPTGGYRIRRRSDRSLLPVEIPAADIRPDPGGERAALVGDLAGWA